MRQFVCQLSLRCLMKALAMPSKDIDLRDLQVGYFSEQADNKGYIIVLDRKSMPTAAV